MKTCLPQAMLGHKHVDKKSALTKMKHCMLKYIKITVWRETSTVYHPSNETWWQHFAVGMI